MIVKTSINTSFQSIAETSLIDGLIDYDKKQGWRGVISNTFETNNSFEDIIYKSNNPFPNKWILAKIDNIIGIKEKELITI